MFQIYLYINRLNEKFYVGQTRQGAEKRTKQHLYSAKTGDTRVIYRAMRKYGTKNFHMHTLVDQIESYEEANRLETFWIKQLRARDPNIGYNMTDGGEGVRDSTGEVAKKLSIATKRHLGGIPERNPAFRQDTPTEEVVARRRRGESVASIARDYGVSDSCIYRRLKKQDVPLTKNMKNLDKEISCLYLEEKYTTPEISALLKISTGKVYYSLVRQGIKLRPPGSRPRLAIKESKKCPGCKTVKPLTDFHNNSRNLDGYGTRCKECDNKAGAAYKVKRKQAEESGVFARRHIDRVEKKCTECKILKPITDFTKDKGSADGHGFYCSDCRPKIGKQRWAKQKAIAATRAAEESSASTAGTPGRVDVPLA